MYFPSYISYDYTKDDIKNIQEDDNKICVICWLPSEENNHIKQLKEFSYIYFFCNCNVIIHTNCLNDWSNISSSCPICRKKITIFTRDHVANYIKCNTIDFFMFFLKYIYRGLRIATIIYIVNMFCVITYNVYIICYFKHHYKYDDYNKY